MKIRLLFDVPVERKHGMREGQVLNVLDSRTSRFQTWRVMDDAGEEVLVHEHEAEVVEEKDDN